MIGETLPLSEEHTIAIVELNGSNGRITETVLISHDTGSVAARSWHVNAALEIWDLLIRVICVPDI